MVIVDSALDIRDVMIINALPRNTNGTAVSLY